MATCAALLLCSACTKVKINSPDSGNPKVSETISVKGAENLGKPLKGTNVSWLIDPLYPNIKPLITYAPNNTSGYVAVMIDNGILNGATPTGPIRFVAVNIQTKTTNIIQVKTPAGAIIETPLGRITRYVWGMNKKLYVSTEAGYGGGGHLVEYDPNTQTAIDLGKPFNMNGKKLEIYMLNTGSDGALYGGSFGDDGDVYTFRYNYDKSFNVDKTPVNADSKYVAYITGNDQYTYATVGQDNWKMYAINRSTGVKTLMMKFDSPNDRIELFSHTDGCFAKRGATHYRLNGITMTAMDNRPLTERVVYSPYDVAKNILPELVWSGNEKKLYYKFNGQEGNVVVNDVIEDIYPTSTMITVNNSLFISASKVPELVSYNRNSGFKYLGNYAITAHSMMVENETTNPTLFMGGYPKGAVMKYQVDQTWTVNNMVPGYSAPDISASQSNPQKITQFQDPDDAGVRGSMYLSGMFYSKNGYLVAGGNNDRLTVSTNRELSIGSLKNGVKRNVYLDEFQKYEYSGMCLSKDSMQVYVAAQSMTGSNGKIYVYNPATNSITGSMDFPLGANPGSISIYGNNIIVGIASGTVYLYDISKKAIIFKHDMGYSQYIYSLVTAPDGSVWINLTGSDVFNTRIVKLIIKSEANKVTAEVSLIANLYDADKDENTKPNNMVFVKTTPGNYDLYISGLKSLYRVNGCCSNS